MGSKMGIILSFIKLSSQDKILAIESIFWITVVRLMIWIFPFTFVHKSVQNMTNSISKKDSKTEPMIPIQRIKFMILLSSRYVPRATCLVKALAGYIMFSRYGYTTLIKIGVLNEDGVFEAHAWLEHCGIVILGESEKEYKTILDIDRGS